MNYMLHSNKSNLMFACREHGVKEFRCFFSLPLPSQIILFQLGHAGDCNERLAINVVLGIDETTTQRVGYFGQDGNKCVCLEPKWQKEFLARSHILYEKVQYNVTLHCTV